VRGAAALDSLCGFQSTTSHNAIKATAPNATTKPLRFMLPL
jgi:hypothetical protein